MAFARSALIDIRDNVNWSDVKPGAYWPESEMLEPIHVHRQDEARGEAGNAPYSIL